MKHIVFALVSAPLVAFAQDLPQTSPAGKVEQVVGLTNIKIEYSRPSAKGRAIFGSLVPMGAVWRTGANKCTTIEFDSPVEIQGQQVSKGKYSLFTVPEKGDWMVILNSNTELWGSDDRDPKLDVVQLKAPARTSAETVETFTIGFDRTIGDNAVIYLAWENTRVEMAVHADATKQGMLNVNEALARKDADYGVYNRCARFCLERGTRLPEALEWAQKSVTMEKHYWNIWTLALALAANGKTEEALATGQESLTLAETEHDNSFVSTNRAKVEEWRTAKPKNSVAR